MGHPDPDVRALCELVGQMLEHLTGKPRGPLSPDDWLTVSALADRTGRSKSCVRHWINRYGLRAKKLPGGGYLVRYGDFMGWRSGGDDIRFLDEAIARIDRRAS